MQSQGKRNFIDLGKGYCRPEPRSVASAAAAPREEGEVYFGMICYLPLHIATAPCALIPSHKAAATLALGSTSTGKVGSQAIALQLGHFSVFASV